MTKRPPDLLIILAIALVPATLILHNFNFYKFLLFYKDSYILFLVYLTAPLVVYWLVNKVFKLKTAMATLAILLITILFFFFGTLQDLFLKYPFTRPFGKTYILPLLFLLPFIYLAFNRSETIRTLRAISFITIFFFL